MDKIWKRKFENKEVKFPSDIATEYCNELYSLTNKLVIAKVEKYEKNIDELNTISPIVNFASATSFFKSKKAEEYLGEVSECGKFTYELYLTGTNTPKYKYRFCFVENGVYPYPAEIILDTDIADELECGTRIVCENEEVYKITLIKILNSKKITEVVEGLMTINAKMN